MSNNSKTIFVLNGPNLNLLGKREPEIYGAQSLVDVEKLCGGFLGARGYDLDFRQSNHEGELVTWLHEAWDNSCGVCINAGAYTHTSIALHDAIRGIEVPVVELHLSNIHAREEFRHTSMIAAACIGQISGFGTASYTLALEALITHIA